MSEQSSGMPKEFWDTINRFLAVAESLETDLSIQQVHSAFLYASSCYSAKRFETICKERGETVEDSLNEIVDIYRDMITNGVKHYGSSTDS